MKVKMQTLRNFFAGKSFYLVLAGCLIATGVAAWTAYSSFAHQNTDDDTISAPEYISSEQQILDTPVAGEASELYSSVEETSEPTLPQTEPVANSFVMPMDGDLIKTYSDSDLIYSKTYKDMRLHLGLDIRGDEGSSVKSCGDGKVVAIIEDSLLGVYVEIDHGNGIVARYCGLKGDLPVAEGDTVEAGQKIGLLSTLPSECEDGAHLHLEFYEEEYPVDPLVIINGER